MKIYEIRDITDEEVYHTKKYCQTAEEAISELRRVQQDISDSPEDGDCVIGGVYEHEVGVWNHVKGFDRKIFEAIYSNTYIEEKDEYIWEEKITKDFNQ